MLKLSSDVDVKQDFIDYKDGTDPEIAFYIRKKSLKLQKLYVNFFGYNIETIK